MKQSSEELHKIIVDSNKTNRNRLLEQIDLGYVAIKVDGNCQSLVQKTPKFHQNISLIDSGAPEKGIKFQLAGFQSVKEVTF